VSVDAVKSAIQRVKPYLDEFQRQGKGELDEDAAVNNSELSTRYIAIDPILRALGWNLDDPRQVILEYRLKRWRNFDLRPDYVFLNPNRQIVGILEAKRAFIHTLSEDALDQVGRYLGEDVVDDPLMSLRFAVITNGQYWTIGFFEGNDVRPESQNTLGIQWHKEEETVCRLWGALASSRYGW
jgi:predicted type IV restriction endonuclease